MKTDAKIYLEAARALGEGTVIGCCAALWDASQPTRREAIEIAFEQLFMPRNAGGFWWRLEDRSSRILALCFAAAMAEAGDL